MKLHSHLCSIAAVLCLFLFSCNKHRLTPELSPESVNFPQTAQEKEVAALHTELAELLRLIYQDTGAYQEVLASVWSGYYDDERVLLSALLAPESHPLFAGEAFAQFNVQKGKFKIQFDKHCHELKFPLLQKHLNLAGYQRGQDWPTGNTTTTSVNGFVGLPQGSGLADQLSIYFPYSDNYNPLVRLSRDLIMPATIVAADRESNEAPGLRPRPCPGNNCFVSVIVNDEYSEENIVHIAGSGATVANPAPVNPPPRINMIMLGSVRCTRQYDNLISFTGNGGGSEIRFVRADSYLEQDADGQINRPQNVISVNFSRKEIRQSKWKTVNGIWDSDWEEDNPEQIFAIYEEDNEGSRTLSGSISAKLKNLTIEPLKYEFTVKTKDDIIRQLGWKRTSFFAFNQGGLNNGCGVGNGFTIYDCRSPVAYTLPSSTK